MDGTGSDKRETMKEHLVEELAFHTYFVCVSQEGNF